MTLGIRASAFLMVLIPTLLPALALSAWFTAARVGDASDELHARGVRESLYLAEASRLALLVVDREALERLAASNLHTPGAARAVLFLDADGGLLAAAGPAAEIEAASNCWHARLTCSRERRQFAQEVRSQSADAARAEFGTAVESAPEPLLGHVLLSFDLQPLAALQRGLLLNAVLSTLAALAIAALIGGSFARRLSEPMQRLAGVVARIRSGELSARTTPGGAGELRALEEGVNAMADRVEAAAAELNRRVDEATAELSSALREREERNRELDLALGRAEAASRAKDMFLARMSHELRTPLSTVTGYAHLMQQSESPEQRADFYRPISQASDILMRTVDDILEFVRLERGSLALERRGFDLESCIEDAVMMQAPVAHDKGLDLVCHVEAGLPGLVIGDAVRIAQVLTNLVSNAVKFTQQGVVTVRASSAALPAQAAASCDEVQRVGVLIEVSDTGIGIPRESVAQLFQPFAQADESMTRRFGGSGLGLSISARIVEAIGGEIRLASEPGQGTRASVLLPLGVEEDPDFEEPTLDAAVQVWAAADSPQALVAADYLARAGLAVTLSEPGAHRLQPGVRLVVLVEDRPLAQTLEPPREVPLLCLRPVEAETDPDRAYLADRLPLPMRRRELLSACARLLGLAPGIARIDTAADSVQPERFELRCLLVEDNELNRRMIATGLRNLGLDVREAAGGDEALRLHGEVEFDLVLLDVHMPGMDGVTLANRLAARDPALPLYALTANVIGSEEQALAAAGVRAVLYKPIDDQRLRAILARHATPVSATLVATSGVGGHEVIAEFRRLARELRDALASEAGDAALNCAHQLLGAARLFTRGDLESWCLRLELRLRDGARAQALEACERVRRGIVALAASVPD